MTVAHAFEDDAMWTFAYLGLGRNVLHRCRDRDFSALRDA